MKILVQNCHKQASVMLEKLTKPGERQQITIIVGFEALEP